MISASLASGGNPAVRVVLLCAEGRAFNAGVDIKELQAAPDFGALVAVNRGRRPHRGQRGRHLRAARGGQGKRSARPQAALDLARQIAAKDPVVIRAAKESLNGIDPVDIRRSCRYGQGYTYELNLTGVAARVRDQFGQTRPPGQDRL